MNLWLIISTVIIVLLMAFNTFCNGTQTDRNAFILLMIFIGLAGYCFWQNGIMMTALFIVVSFLGLKIFRIVIEKLGMTDYHHQIKF